MSSGNGDDNGDGSNNGDAPDQAMEQAAQLVHDLVELAPTLSVSRAGLLLSMVPDKDAAVVVTTDADITNSVVNHAVFVGKMPNTSSLFTDVFDAILHLAELGLDDVITNIMVDIGKVMSKHYEPAVKAVDADDTQLQ